MDVMIQIIVEVSKKVVKRVKRDKDNNYREKGGEIEKSIVGLMISGLNYQPCGRD